MCIRTAGRHKEEGASLLEGCRLHVQPRHGGGDLHYLALAFPLVDLLVGVSLASRSLPVRLVRVSRMAASNPRQRAEHRDQQVGLREPRAASVVAGHGLIRDKQLLEHGPCPISDKNPAALLQQLLRQSRRPDALDLLPTAPACDFRTVGCGQGEGAGAGDELRVQAEGVACGTPEYPASCSSVASPWTARDGLRPSKVRVRGLEEPFQLAVLGRLQATEVVDPPHATEEAIKVGRAIVVALAESAVSSSEDLALGLGHTLAQTAPFVARLRPESGRQATPRQRPHGATPEEPAQGLQVINR
mmetsp:Transcript_62833/g.194526  ORF Transcript_62833/g.194526 Transcript_62833/m.194526 type:complete len:302 (+) Transcript_62833:54-959(+)